MIEADYADKDVLLVGVLKGAVMVMADLARELRIHANMDWMAVSSYGTGTQSSGVVRILKDLDTDLTGRHVLIVEDIIDSGLTLQLAAVATSSPAVRHPSRSAPCCASRMRPRSRSTSKYLGFDIPNQFVVGYGLDYAEKYRNLRDVGSARTARLQLSRQLGDRPRGRAA